MKDLGFRVQDEGLRITVKTLYKNPVLNFHYLLFANRAAGVG